MDVQSSFSLLIKWFKNNDSFCLSKNFRSLDWKLLGAENESLNDEDAKTCLEIALADMHGNGMIKVSEKGVGKQKEKIYFIVESMKNSPVELYISRQTSENLKKVALGLLPLISLDFQFSENEDASEEHVILLLEAVSLLSQNLQKEIEKNKNLHKPNTGNNNELTGGI